ncbi:serine/threonine protein kinase [Amycolatopsis pittospori]|uniref:serine/threonine protein kinase n=1 Tax=Amycolatopsis pittospori TaxID=2749434 RepID=UPI0015F1066B|nr:protein kinase [Amycolatopsis pittospori]
MATVMAGPGDTVLKVYPAALDRGTRTALDREQALLSGLGHASILPVDEIGELADGRVTLRMPRCERSLATLTEPLPLRDVLVLGEVISQALAAAHRAGVVHGAVTPGNILFRAGGEPVVGDFGTTLRRRFPRDPLHELEFAAPETVRDQTMDERTDRYGLGAVLYLALTGEPPHRTVIGEEPGARIHRVLTEVVAPITRPGVPDDLVALVADLLDKDPERRPAHPEELFAASRTALPPGLPAKPILVLGPPREGWPPPVKRSKQGWWVAAGLVAFFGLGYAGLVAGNTRPDSPPSPITIELAPPVDKGDHIELSWISNADMDYAVILAEEGRTEPQVILAHRSTRRRIDVRPDLRYCLLIQGKGPQGTYESRIEPIRGAVCRK